MTEPAAGQIQVALGTYNLGKYLDEFMQSLLAQECDNWLLLARDDGSNDNTRDRLHHWKQQLGTRMEILPDSGTRNLGCCGNFSNLLAASSAPYVMLADPDDVWLPTKVSTTLAAMRRREAEVGVNRPCLVHTDLVMVDQDLQPLAPSFWRYQGLSPERGRTLAGMIVENQVWACTTMLNRPLIDLVGTIPDESIHQDWWIGLVAAAFGEIVSVRKPTLLWRRHSANNSPVSKLDQTAWRAVTRPGDARRRLVELFEESRPRVRAFLDRYRDRLSPKQVAAAEAFLELPKMGLLGRRRAILRHRLLFTSPVRNLGFLALA